MIDRSDSQPNDLRLEDFLRGRTLASGIFRDRFGKLRRQFQMEIDGRGQPGFVKAEATVRLEDAGDGTKLVYDSDAKVGGRVATVGQRLLDSSAKAITKQSLEGLSQVIESRASAVEGEDPVEIEGPSQAEFARNVAKEVAKDLVPMPVLIGGLLVIAIVLILIFLL